MDRLEMQASATLTGFTIVTAGVLGGVAMPTWTTLLVFSAVVGVILNLWLLIQLVRQKKAWGALPGVVIGSIPAGLFDGVKILLLGALVRGGLSLIGLG